MLEFILMLPFAVVFWGISFAVVGKGNRLLWILVGPLAGTVISLPFMVVAAIPDMEGGFGLIQKFIGICSIFSIPALSLVAAVIFKRWRARSPGRNVPDAA